MQRKPNKHRLLPAALSLAMVLTMVPAHAAAAGQQPPVPETTVNSDQFSHAFKLDFGYQNSGWMERITALSVDGVPYEQVSSTIYLKTGTYVVQPSDGRIVLPPSLSGKVTCVIRAEGYEELNLSLDTSTSTVAVNPPAPAGTLPAAELPGGMSASLEQAMSVYLKLTITGAQGYVDGITAIRRTSPDGSGADLAAVPNRTHVDGPTYFLDGAESAVYFDAMNPAVKDGDTLRITSGQYKDLLLKITRSGDGYQVQVFREEQPQPADEQVLHVRLAGSLPAAPAGQIYGKNTLEVQCALAQKGASPAENDWKPLHKSGLILAQEGAAVAITPQGSGLTGTYSPADGTITLTGTPAQAGSYQVAVTVTDSQGRKAVTTAVPLQVYAVGEKLSDRLTLGNSVREQNGSYRFEMNPRTIKEFGGIQETVTVPAQIRTWSGTTGARGTLGYALPEGREPVQTLLVPAGCDLTMEHMDLLGSVKVVVQSGGRLTLRNTTVEGVVEVEKGGSFSMNYDNGKFLTGAAINGQLRLKTGAVLENAAIYAAASQTARATQPVVAVQGDVTVKGSVFLRGDEVLTGSGLRTGKSYTGRTGLLVSGGTLTLDRNSLLAVYGGGMQMAATAGADAIQLDRGDITGSGTLVAVGGDGSYDRGGDAVSGRGTLSVAKAYLQGGASFNGTAFRTGGKAVTAGVYAPKAVKNDGPAYRNERENPRIPRWTASVAPSYLDAQRIISYVTAQTAPTAKPTQPGSGKPGDKRPGTGQSKPTGKNTVYTVRVSAASHGSVSVKDSQAEEGDLLRLMVKPEKGYVLDQLTVTDQKGKAVKLTQKSENKYTFAMPASAVTIQASFVKESDTRKPAKPAVPATPLVPAKPAAPVTPTVPTTPTVPVTPATPAAVPFKDVSPKDYCYAAVQWAVGKNVTQGTSANTFSPEAQCTRAQVVTFLWRAAGSPAPKNRTLPFRDVKPGDYCYDAVCWAVEKGITGGTGANTFSPDLVVTRAQAVALLHRAAGSPAARTASAFSDVKSGSYYAAAAQWASAQGITQGTGANRFSPDKDCTRGQIVALLYRGVQQSVFTW